MQQKGLILNTSQVVDRLVYAHQQSGGMSNKLASVTDSSTNTAPLGDFKNGVNSGDDYAYDGNGNLTLDNNKKITTINYNLLNLPASIAINGKGAISYIYDATGNKLKKTTFDSTTTPVKTTITTYTGSYVYNNDILQLLSHEEGRIRPKLIVPATGWVASNIQYIYDYFIKDHLGNTRMVLTEEADQLTYAATMEAANAGLENQLFDSVSSTQLAKPAGFDTDTSNHYVSRLNASSSVNKLVGPAILLKVMAGDTLTASTYAWYNTAVQAPTAPSLLNSLLPGLTNGAIATSSGHLIMAEQAGINTAFTSSLPNLFTTRDATYNSSLPKAFLNWALFDERFNYVSGGVTQVQTINPGDYKKAIAASLPTTITKNGYLYVYVSNESPQDVFFDNVTIQHKKGPLVEETHYYPFGLAKAGISSKAFKTGYSENKYRYNGKELQNKEYSDGGGLEWQDYGARMYESQIGRCKTIDPLSEHFPGLSGFTYTFNNPIKCIDPTGMEGEEADPGYTVKDVIEAGRKSKYFRGLMEAAGITLDNYQNFISFASDDSKDPTSTSVMRSSGNIQIDPNKSKNDNILGLAHELTNLSMKGKYQSLILDVTFGHITPDQYAKKALFYEANAIFSQFKVAKELKFKTFGKGSESGSNRDLIKYEKGLFTDKSLLRYLENNVMDDYDPVTHKRGYDIYRENGEIMRDTYLKSQQNEDNLKPDSSSSTKLNCYCVTPPWVKP